MPNPARLLQRLAGLLGPPNRPSLAEVAEAVAMVRRVFLIGSD